MGSYITVKRYYYGVVCDVCIQMITDESGGLIKT